MCIVDHARLSFSHSDLWMGCAAWPRITTGVCEETSPEIQFGNASHEILEHMLLDTPHKFSESSDEALCAQETYEFVQSAWATMGLDETHCLAEARLKATSTGRTDLWGTADVILYNDDTLHVIDHKTGVGTFVDAETSNQLKWYAVAAIDTLGINPENIVLTISQPRFWGDEAPQRSHHMTKDELMVWLALEGYPAAQATDDPNAVGSVTERCKKCSGRHVCEYRDSAVAGALIGKPPFESTLLTTMGVQELDIRRQHDLTIYDNERLGEVLDLLPVIREYCDSLEDHAQSIIMKGETVPGYKVVTTGGREKWLDTDEVEKALYKTKVAKNAFKHVLKTPKQVMGLSPSAGLKKKLQALIGRSDNGLALAMSSDPRESAAPAFEATTAEEVFAATTPQQELEQPTTQEPAALPSFLL